MVRVNNLPDYRQLESRSSLDFYYPDGKIITIPFFENPSISEKSSANLVEYNPLARAGSLFAYTGSKARSFSLQLQFTHPHLQYYDMGIEKYNKVFADKSKRAKKLLFYNNNKTSADKISGQTISLEATRVYNELVKPEGVDEFGDPFEPAPPSKDRAIDTLVFFLAVIRTSIMNNVSNPLQGPPTVRINFGTAYQDIPCLVRDYSISWDEAGGYDVPTLTPRKFKINLELVEVRLGDFTTFERADLVKRDNLAGWEVISSSPYSNDPGPPNPEDTPALQKNKALPKYVSSERGLRADEL